MLIWFIISVILNLLPHNTVATWVSIVMIGGDLGGTANFLVSMTTRVFGRRDFSAAYAVIFPIYNALRMCAFAYTGLMAKFASNVFGQTYAGGYLGLIALCLISMVCISGIDYTKSLGHDDDLGDLS